MIFINLKKVYDKILQNVMWWEVEKKIVQTKYIIVINDMYINIVISVRACDDKSNIYFFIKIELHQGSTFSSYMRYQFSSDNLDNEDVNLDR
jgi:hypothetical protein